MSNDPSDIYPLLDFWNQKVNRKATLKEEVKFILTEIIQIEEEVQEDYN